MSGVIGKGNKSYIKQATGDSLLPDFNVTSLVWVHEVDANTVSTNRIDFNSLNFPTTNAIRQNGFTNPANNRILALGIGNHRTNLTVRTSLKRTLIDFLAYEADDTGITLDASVTPVLGESFVFTFDQNVQTGNRVVNARPLRKTGIIPAQRRRVAIGSTIEIAPSILNADGIDQQQIGNIQVFAEGKLLFRNPANAEGDIITSGNYREVFLDNVTDAGIESANIIDNGTANAIELNVALPQEADVMIISTNLIVDSETNTISTLTNEAATKLNELPTLDVANAGSFLSVNSAGDGYDLVAQDTNFLSPQARVLTNPTPGSANLSRNWTCPDNVNEIYLTLAGGGQGGQDEGNGGQGGAAGSVFSEKIEVIAGQTYTISVGSGGNVSGGPTRNGGGNTSFVGSATALINGGPGATITSFSPVSTTATGTATPGATPTITQTKRAGAGATNFILTHDFGRFTNTGNTGGVGGANILAQGGTEAQGGAGGAGYLDGNNSISGVNAGQAGGDGGIRIQFLGRDGEGLISN